MNRERSVCRDVSVGFDMSRRARDIVELQSAGVEYFIRSLPSEKYRRAICRSCTCPSVSSQQYKQGLAYLELHIIVRIVDQMYYASKRSLLFDGLVCFLTSPDGTTRVTSLLQAFLDQHFQDLKDSLEVLLGGDLCSVPQ